VTDSEVNKNLDITFLHFEFKQISLAAGQYSLIPVLQQITPGENRALNETAIAPHLSAFTAGISTLLKRLPGFTGPVSSTTLDKVFICHKYYIVRCRGMSRALQVDLNEFR
jgi:hypothetical protein